MEPISLAIDIDAVRVRAVCRWQNGSTTPLYVDERPTLPAQVFVDSSGTMLTGTQAATGGAMTPAAMIVSPMSGLGGPVTDVAGHRIDPVDPVAALIERCAREARHAGSAQISDVCVAVPASWGPRRRALLRQATQRAGFTDAQLHLIPAPVAAAVYATRTAGMTVPIDGIVAVYTVEGNTVCATVLHRRTDIDWDVLSSITRPAIPAAAMGADDPTSDPPAYGHTVNATAHANDGHSPELGSADARWQALVVQAIVEAIDAANVDIATVSGILHVGAADGACPADAAITDVIGVPVWVPPRADEAVALGCAVTLPAHATNAANWSPTPAPRVRMAKGGPVATAVAGLASLLLVTNVLATASTDTYNGNAFMDHGEFAAACLLAIVAACTTARSLVIIHADARAERHIPDHVTQPQKILATAAGIGIAIAVIYALYGAEKIFIPKLRLQGPENVLVPTALLATAPIAVCACWIALILPRLRYLGGGVLHQLRTPITPMVLACGGLLLIHTMYYSEELSPAVENGGRIGGALVAAGCAWLLTRNRAARLIAVPIAAFLGAFAIDLEAASAYGYCYMVCTELWWLIRTVAITYDAFPRLRTLTWPPPPVIDADTAAAPTSHVGPTPAPADIGASRPPSPSPNGQIP